MQANAANSCGKTTAIKQNIHMSNGFNHSVSITNGVQSSAQVKPELHSGIILIIPEENELERSKPARCVTSAYLTVSNMTLTEDGSHQSLVEMCQLSSTVRHPGTACLRSFNKEKTAPVPEMQSALGAGLSELSADATNHLFTKKKTLNIKPTHIGLIENLYKYTYRNVTLVVCQDKHLHRN